jgi:D-beta-D-heptose 7-phosphate kinase/D-beta-D-heptose 1-phosphate adenosyltransferase
MNESKSTQLQKPYNILLIGDNCTDVYQYGIIDRISPEAPVPVFKLQCQESKPGMAGNVCKNLEKLNCKVEFYYDKVSIKTRLIDLKSKQHIVRIDEDYISDPVSVEHINFNKYDAVVISDYNKGTVDQILLDFVSNNASIPVFIDTKKTQLSSIKSAWVKINSAEFENLKSKCNNLIVTLGEQGAKYNDRIFPAKQVEVSDVCGAGDTFLSALTVAYLNTGSIESAIEYANKASAITVQHTGVYAPSMEEIL